MKKSTLKRLTNYTNYLETILEDFEDVVSDLEYWLYNNEDKEGSKKYYEVEEDLSNLSNVVDGINDVIDMISNLDKERE